MDRVAGPGFTRRWRRSFLWGLGRIAIVLVLLYTLIPILWVVAISFRNPVQTMTIPPEILVQPTFRHYQALFSGVRETSPLITSTRSLYARWL